MNWILYPLAAFGALSLLIVLYFGWRIVRKWKAGAKATKEMLGIDSFGDIMKSPEAGLIAEIPDVAEPIWALANPDWINEDAVLARIGEFKALGFQSLGTYSGYAGITPMELLFHSSGIIAMVGEDQEGEQSRCKVFGFQTSGAPVIISDRTESCSVAQIPGEIRVYRQAETAHALCGAFSKALQESGGQLQPLTAETVIPQLESLMLRRAYFLSANPQVVEPWLRERGEGSGYNLLDSSVKRSLSECATECCRTQYSHESGLSAASWERTRDRLVFVHDRSLRSEFDLDEPIEDEGLSSTDMSDLLAKSDGPIDRAAFATHNASLPAHARMRPLAQLTQPVAADVYLKP